jgi:ribosomal-protein-serine acetyltransferase
MFHLTVDSDLELRLLTEAHCDPLFALIEVNRAQLRRWLPWVDGTRTLEDTRRYIRFGLRQNDRCAGMHAGVWVCGQLAGIISYNYVDMLRSQTELGYWLGAAFQGRGVMTAACRALTTDAFQRLRLQRVEIRCAVANEKSRAIPERLGYHIEGIAPQLDWMCDHYIDTVVYAITAAEWQEGAEDDRRCRQF